MVEDLLSSVALVVVYFDLVSAFLSCVKSSSISPCRVHMQALCRESRAAQASLTSARLFPHSLLLFQDVNIPPTTSSSSTRLVDALGTCWAIKHRTLARMPRSARLDAMLPTEFAINIPVRASFHNPIQSLQTAQKAIRDPSIQTIAA